MREGMNMTQLRFSLLIFCKPILIVNRQEWWLCVVPLPSSTFGGWRVLVRNLSRSWCSWISPISSRRHGAAKRAKLASSLPAAATDLMSLKTASLPPQSQHTMSDHTRAHSSGYDKSHGLSAANLVPWLSARELPTLFLMKRIEIDVVY